MDLLSYSATDVGLVRQINQDSLLVDQKNRLFIVADGMGGHQGGEVASKIAVKAVSKFLTTKAKKSKLRGKKGGGISLEDIKMACMQANKYIYEKGQKEDSLRGMGTTLCFLYVKPDGEAYIANIGDSRLYMEKEGQMWLLTEDHSFATDELKASFLSGESNTSSAIRENNVLTRSVGYHPSVEPDIFEKKLEKGEKYLICSDGLCGFVPDAEIQDLLKNRPLKDIPAECVKKALETGGEDNISVIVVEVQ